MHRFLIVGVLSSVGLAASCHASAADLPSLPGTNWQLLSLTKGNEPIKDAQNPADVEFLKDGTWGILHYGGRREAGKYQVAGERLVMRTDDGEIYNDAKMVYRPASEVLELYSDDGYLMRFRRQKPR